MVGRTRRRADGAGRAGRRVRNAEWLHMYNDIISMPDKWEYPWFAAWDLAFHMLPFMIVDGDFAKEQLDLMLRNDYLHPNGRIPAYEWNFGDVNPPVHAYATIQNYLSDKARNEGKGDVEFLKYASKLLVNFTWWVNRKDRAGNNCFEGGFLGLDNIGVFDRSAPCRPAAISTRRTARRGWSSSVNRCCGSPSSSPCKTLTTRSTSRSSFSTPSTSPAPWIGSATERCGTKKTASSTTSCACPTLGHAPQGSLDGGTIAAGGGGGVRRGHSRQDATGTGRMRTFIRRHPELCAGIHMPGQPGVADRRMVSIVNEHKLRRILTRMLDESEFFGPYGIRALSRSHLEHPFVFHVGGQEYRVAYLPGDSDSGMFGGNSNWRGPVWMPVNLVLLTALYRLYAYFGDDFTVECPTGSGNMMTLLEVAHELGERLTHIPARRRRPTSRVRHRREVPGGSPLAGPGAVL